MTLSSDKDSAEKANPPKQNLAAGSALDPQIQKNKATAFCHPESMQQTCCIFP